MQLHQNPLSRIHLTVVVILAASFVGAAAAADLEPTRGLTEVHHSKVKIRDGFWGRRLSTHHQVTIPHVLNKLAGHVQNFDKAAGCYDGPLVGHHAYDSDLHKGLEAALCTLAHRHDPALMKRVDKIIDRSLYEVEERTDGVEQPAAGA